MLRLVALTLLLLIVPRAGAQDASPPDAAPAAEASAAPAPPADDAAREGEAALDAAARFQRGDTPRAAPTSLHGAFHVTAKDAQGSQIKAEVERWYTRAPERLLTRRKEELTGTSDTSGLSDGVAWWRDDKSGKVVTYSDDPETYDVDLGQLQEQLHVTRLLMDACVLDALRARLSDVRAIDRETLTDPDGVTHEVVLVEATAPDELYGRAPHTPPPRPGEAPPRLQLRFGIGADDGALWSLQVQAPHRPDVPSMRLVFAFHAPTRDGLRVPANIRLFRGDEPDPALKLGIEEDEQGELRFDLDKPLEAALFARPEPAGG